MMWFYITYNGPGYVCQISDGTVKKGNYIYTLKTTMKYSLDWYGFDSKDIYSKQDKESKYAVKLTQLWFKDKNFILN